MKYELFFFILILGLLKFQKSKDNDGFLGDFSSKTQLTNDIYQIKVQTVPGNGLFEVSVSHDITKNVFKTQVSLFFHNEFFFFQVLKSFMILDLNENNIFLFFLDFRCK